MPNQVPCGNDGPEMAMTRTDTWRGIWAAAALMLVVGDSRTRIDRGARSDDQRDARMDGARRRR